MNLLFICSMNKWRSPTAERVFRQVEAVSVRSAGTSRKARRQITIQDIRWANVICVMESKHLSRLRGDFRSELIHKETHVLDIPDEYQFMDPELVELLRVSVMPIIDR